MRTFEQLRRYIKENIPDPFKTKKGEGPDFEKNLKKATTKTYKQKGLDLYKAGGPYIPDKEVSQKTGKKVTQQIKKPYFGKPTLPKKTNKAPDRTGLKKAISDVRAGERRLYDAGVGKKPSLVQQRKFTLSKIKELSRQTTRQDAYNRAFGSGTFNYSKRKKLDKEISARRSAETTRGDAINRAMGTSGSTEGSAGASGSSKTVTPTKGVKQSEVSKKAKDFTKKINQQRKVTTSGTPMRKGATSVPKDAAKDIQVGKMKNRIKELSAEREKMRSFTGKKDVKGMRAVNKQIKQYQKSIKSNPFAPTVYDPKNKPTTTGTTGSSKVTQNLTRGKKPYQPKTKVTGDINKVGRPKNIIRSKGSSIPVKPKVTGNFTRNTSGYDKFYSDKAYKAARKLPKPVQKLGKSKAVQKILKSAIKNPYVAAGAAIVGTAAAGYGAYKAYKAFKKDKTKLSYKDFKSLSTPSDPNKGKIMSRETGKPARFSSSSKIPKSSSTEFKSKYYYK